MDFVYASKHHKLWDIWFGVNIRFENELELLGYK